MPKEQLRETNQSSQCSPDYFKSELEKHFEWDLRRENAQNLISIFLPSHFLSALEFITR